MDLTLVILIVCLCLGLSFLLSGMEAGVLALSRLRIRQLMRTGNVHARQLHEYLENPEHFLWTILVGNTVTNFAAISLMVYLLYQGLGEIPMLFVIALLAVVFLFYSLGDLLPKMLFRMFPNRLCMLLARPFRVVHLLLEPAVVLVAGFANFILRWTGGKAFTGHLFGNRDELRMVMQDSSHGLTTEERSMIDRVLDLQNITVRQIYIPLEKTVKVSKETPLRKVLDICRDRNLTRLPVEQESGTHRRILGLISLKPLIYRSELDPDRPAGDYVLPALYLNEDMRLDVAMRRMRRGGQRLAIVLGRNQREIGILSLQDILQVVFGDVSL